MFKYLYYIVIIGGIAYVYGQTWERQSCVVNYINYFSKVLQEATYNLEEMEWCNMKVLDFTRDVNLQMYKWHVNGTVTYLNGFVKSIQRIDISNFQQAVLSTTENNVTLSIATVTGRLNFRDLRIGFDVWANLTDEEPQRYTAVFTHNPITMLITIRKDLFSKEITVATSTLSASGPVRDYSPRTNVTEVLSRGFIATSVFESITTWGREIIGPIILNIVTNKIEFPFVDVDCY